MTLQRFFGNRYIRYDCSVMLCVMYYTEKFELTEIRFGTILYFHKTTIITKKYIVVEQPTPT